MCTHVAHSFILQKIFFLSKKIFSCGTRVCRLGAHTLSHYTFFSGSDMVLYLCKISACCVKRKCKSRGGQIKCQKPGNAWFCKNVGFFQCMVEISAEKCTVWVHILHKIHISQSMLPSAQFILSKNSKYNQSYETIYETA